MEVREKPLTHFFKPTLPPPDIRGIPSIEQLENFGLNDMEPQEVVAMFQPMIDSGVLWHFPLDYIQAAAFFVQQGLLDWRPQ